MAFPLKYPRFGLGNVIETKCNTNLDDLHWSGLLKQLNVIYEW